MGLDEVVDKLNKTVLANTKIPEDARMMQVEKLIPDKAKILSRQRMEIIKKLKNREYKSNKELRKDLKRINNDLSWAILVNVNLQNLDFSNVNFSVADLSGSDFSGCNLHGADFSIAKLSGTMFINARMEVAIFTMVDCSNADFSGANVSMANFSSCIAINTNFSNANLANCDFFNSNLRNANFNGANTAGINLADCLLDGTIFEGRLETGAEKERKYKEYLSEIYRATEEIRKYISSRPVYSTKDTRYKTRREYK